MTVVAIGMVRDEADIIGYTLQHLIDEGVDRIVVADNRSTDNTRNVLATCARLCTTEILVIDDPVAAYQQSTKMTQLARDHAADGDWVVPFDADELWYALDGTLLADTLEDLDADVAVAHPWVQVPTDFDNPDDPNPFTRIRYRMTRPEAQGKVAFRWSPGAELDMGNHAVFGAGSRRLEGIIGVRHLQYRTLEQTARKVANGVEAMAATGFSPHICAHWHGLAAMTGPERERWWDEYRAQGTVLDPPPWRP